MRVSSLDRSSCSRATALPIALLSDCACAILRSIACPFSAQWTNNTRAKQRYATQKPVVAISRSLRRECHWSTAGDKRSAAVSQNDDSVGTALRRRCAAPHSLAHAIGACCPTTREPRSRWHELINRTRIGLGVRLPKGGGDIKLWHQRRHGVDAREMSAPRLARACAHSVARRRYHAGPTRLRHVGNACGSVLLRCGHHARLHRRVVHPKLGRAPAHAEQTNVQQ